MRRNIRHVSSNPGERASIGDHYVTEACKAIDITCQKTVTVMTHWQHTRETTLPMLFDDHVIDKMHAVRGMVDHRSDNIQYPIADGATLTINFDGARLPAIRADMLRADRAVTASGLLAHIAAIRAVHDRFEEVKGVLRWCNKHCTPGAIRYNFPQALKLCPTAPAFKDMDGVPTRHSNPANIGGWLQPIKDAASTLAQSAMLPDDIKPRDKGTMWLTFASKTVHLSVDAHYSTDIMTYNF